MNTSGYEMALAEAEARLAAVKASYERDLAAERALCEREYDANVGLEAALAAEREAHAATRAQLAEAQEKLAEREATVDILVQRVHERNDEIAELKRSGKTERRFTNDYIKALHKAERERDDLRARLDAALGGRDE